MSDVPDESLMDDQHETRTPRCPRCGAERRSWGAIEQGHDCGLSCDDCGRPVELADRHCPWCGAEQWEPTEGLR